MATMTVRSMPDELHTWLKRQAEAHHRSVNKEVIALLESLRRQPETLTPQGKYERILEISRCCAALPVLDDRSEDEILGYDENGLPS